MKIKFTKHPYPESLDADDAPPHLGSFSVSESECEFVNTFYTLVNAAGGQPPAGPPLRGPPAGQRGFTGNPRTRMGYEMLTRENSISNSNVVLNGTCHEFDSCKV